MTRPSQTDAVDIPPNIEFSDPTTAARYLDRLRRRLSTKVFEVLVQSLSTSPNPDSVIVQFERLVESMPVELADIFEQQPILIHYATLICGHSAWLGETLIQNTDLLRRFARKKDLERSYSRERFREEFARIRSGASAGETAGALARFRKREYVRILLRDVLGIAMLAETTEEISALSDALIEEALREVNSQLQQQHGTPMGVDAQGRLRESRFAVISLGKLGGNELNYSSDIDLMFLYDGETEPPSSSISNREYFIRLAQQTTELLSRPTKEGQVFRIDLRLRPQGHEGEVAVALSQARQYYSEVAQDWELQAMIKARHSAGDAALSREFIRGVEPYVYHPDVNFVAVKTALQSRERFDRRGSGPLTRGLARGRIDVKLDRGGIRDIEFLVQCLQRQYGGSETWLRSRGTLFALQKLHDKGHLSGNDFHNLNSAYEFLRHLEHRLQLRQGRQSHQLPNRQSDLKELSTCLNRDGSLVSEPDRFVLQVRRQMEAVVAIYRRIIFQEQSHQLVDPRGNVSLQAQSPSTVEDSFSQIMHRLAVDSPRLLDSISRADLSQHARLNLDRFFRSASASSERYTAILNSPESVERALAVFEDSEYLTNILVRFPAEVTLLDGVDDQPPNEATATLFDLTPERRAVVPDPVLTDLSESKIARAEALASVRQWFRHSLFASGARDMCQQRGVFEALKVNTSAADKAVQAALAIAEPPPGFAVMAVGRLGSCEFDLLSDADILFVADDACDRDSVRRTAEHIVDYLTAYTRDGTLFPVDTRLRPQGREGELVTTPERLARYFQRDAQPWEALTFLRLRLIAGDIVVGEQAIAVVREGIAEIAQRPGFDRELVEMRQRLELRDPDQNLKSGPGGTYDIDFLAGRYQAKHRLWEAGNLVNRLSLLRHRGLLAEEEYEVLSRNAELLRSVEHFVRLVTGLPRKWLPVAKHARDSVEKLMTRWALYDKSRSLNDVLDEITRQTRSICLNHRI